MKDKSLCWSIVALLTFLLFCFIAASLDLYYSYHARMHCSYTWGKIIDVNNPSGKSPTAVIIYKVGDETYRTHIPPINCRHLGDSVMVAYDTTRCKRGFVLLRNPHDSETAFFKTEEKYLGVKWHNNLEKYKSNLAEKQEAHRRRAHFYDYFCHDEH